jgi:transposase
MQLSTIGFDLGVHGIDADEKVVIRKQLRRNQVKAFFEGIVPCRHGSMRYGASLGA